jgi:cysteinyl-tRNA synthetase
MVSMAERLEDLGHAYLSASGNLYYAVGSFPEYGRLSGNSLDQLRAGHRSEVESDKRDPADFALWKAAGAGRMMRWPTTRWGEGFPGWHLECSAMALRHLGPHFDIHTGGEDNVFPHHEDEIAQSAPIVGGPPATLWVHGAHLLMDGLKMAKSAGNFQRITELVDEGVDPLAFRYLCLTSRYARKLDYSDASLAAASAALSSLRERLRALGEPPSDGTWAPPIPLVAGAAPGRPVGQAAGFAGHGSDPSRPEPPLTDRTVDPAAPLSAEGARLHAAFASAVDDDLDMPRALATVRAMLRATIPPDERRWLILDADAVLGLDLHAVWYQGARTSAPSSSAQQPLVETLLAERAAARERRDYPEADRLREELRELGAEPVDHADGTSSWRPVTAGDRD